MCGRYTIPASKEIIKKRFGITNNLPDLRPTYNATPSQMLPVIIKNSPKKGYLMKWGFIPTWQEFKDAKFMPINARSDKLSGGYYREAFKNHRCLIPATGFYEWKKYKIDKKEEKQPYYFNLKDRELFSFGGIYSIKEDSEGTKHYFFAIITTPPNKVLKPVHNRMPLIIDPKDEDRWLDTDKPEILVKPYDGAMKAIKVGKKVNNPENDGKELIIPLNHKTP
jgi:putative SOS response-associated peptidase YedK